MDKTRRTLTLAIATVAALLALAAGAVAPASAASSPNLTGVSLTLSYDKIYPHIDGYRDSLRIVVAKQVSGTTASIPLTGRVRIGHAGTTVASYPIATSSTETYSWNGRIGTRGVPGTYTVTATVTGPNGTITKRASVVVSLRKLVPTTRTVTYTAQTFFQHSYTALSAGTGCEPEAAGALDCTSVPLTRSVGGNSVGVPGDVLTYAGYSPYSARVAVTLSHVTIEPGSQVYWEWDGSHTWAFTVAGTHTTSTSSFGSASSTQDVRFHVGGGSEAQFDTISIRYAYSILE